MDLEPGTEPLGTPGFMSPEQESDGILTTAGDVYGLGITLCHLFQPNAKRPSIFAVMASAAGSLPTKLVSLLEEMIADEPQKRPESMHVVA